jgi:hypothetical protein
MGKATSQRKDSSTSAPPAWALPLLTTAANAGMNLYNSGQGFNTPYTGRTVADFNPTKLAAMNNIMKLTGGGGGPPITNDSIFGQNQQLQNIQQLIAARQAQNQAAMRPPTPMPVQPTPMPQQQTYGTYAPGSPGRMGSNR